MRDNEIVDFIISFAVDHGYLPTITQIAEACYMCTSNVWYRLRKLEDKGIVIRHGQQWGIKGLTYVYKGE